MLLSPGMHGISSVCEIIAEATLSPAAPLPPRRMSTDMGLNWTRPLHILVMALVMVPFTMPTGHLAFAQEQERKVPSDSARVSIAGCARGRIFIVGEAPDHEPTNNSIQPGRRFRLSGKKQLLGEIKEQEGKMVSVTGLVRLNDLRDPGGIKLGGGRVRIGGGSPRDPMTGVRNDPGVSQSIIDVESWRPLQGYCPAR